MVDRKVIREREERQTRRETRIERDVRTFVGWAYIKKLVELCEFPELVMALFLTGGRASEVLELTGGMFTEYEDYYEVVGMPVYKRFDILDKYTDEEGKRRWHTELVMERRTFSILKLEPYSIDLWNYAHTKEDKLFTWKEVKDQYWQLYNTIHSIKAPKNPYAPEHIYPHWLRGMRAAQLRVEYGLDIDQIMRFFNWKSYRTAQHYAGMSSRDIAEAMLEGAKTRPRREEPIPVQWKEEILPSTEPKKEEGKIEKERRQTSKDWFFSSYEED